MADDIDLRTDIPHAARIYDYLLGGTDNYAADRAAANAISMNLPNIKTSMRHSRRFMARAAHYMAADLGIRQFLDIGTGLPTAPNLHEVVQQVAPESRVLYVDNDPIVLAHARALLKSTPEGKTAYLDADLREPAKILATPEFVELFDTSKPMAVSLLAIMQYITNDGVAKDIIRQLTEWLPAGSALAISLVTTDSTPEEAMRGIESYRRQGIDMIPRDKPQTEALFEGFTLVEPGVTLIHRWQPDPADAKVEDHQIYMYGGLGVKA